MTSSRKGKPMISVTLVHGKDLWGQAVLTNITVYGELHHGDWSLMINPGSAHWLFAPLVPVSDCTKWDLLDEMTLCDYRHLDIPMPKAGADIRQKLSEIHTGMTKDAMREALKEVLKMRLTAIRNRVGERANPLALAGYKRGWESYLDDAQYIKEGALKESKGKNRGKGKDPNTVRSFVLHHKRLGNKVRKGREKGKGRLLVDYWSGRVKRPIAIEGEDSEGRLVAGVTYERDDEGRQIVCITPYMAVKIFGKNVILNAERVSNQASINMLGALFVRDQDKHVAFNINEFIPEPGEIPARALRRRLEEVLDCFDSDITTLGRTYKIRTIRTLSGEEAVPLPEETPILTGTEQDKPVFQQPELDLEEHAPVVEKPKPEPEPEPEEDRSEPEPDDERIVTEEDRIHWLEEENKEIKKTLAAILVAVREPKILVDKKYLDDVEKECYRLKCDNMDLKDEIVTVKAYCAGKCEQHKQAATEAIVRCNKVQSALHDQNQEAAESTIFDIDAGRKIKPSCIRKADPFWKDGKVVSSTRIAIELNIGSGNEGAEKLNNKLIEWGIMERVKPTPTADKKVLRPTNAYINVLGDTEDYRHRLGRIIDIVIQHPNSGLPESTVPAWSWTVYGAAWIKAEWRRRMAEEAKTK